MKVRTRKKRRARAVLIRHLAMKHVKDKHNRCSYMRGWVRPEEWHSYRMAMAKCPPHVGCPRCDPRRNAP